MDVLGLLHEETGALVRTVDSLDDEALAAPSSLPGWSRAHVVAHLALNAEGLGRAVEAVRRGRSVPQYDSDEARDTDIEALAAADPVTLRARFLASTTLLADALGSVRDDEWDATVERHPGGTTFPVAQVPSKRLVEVALHHVDLDAGRGPRDVPAPGAAVVVDVLFPRLRRMAPVRLHATDVDRTWRHGDGGRVVRGDAADLAWWLSGRGNEEGPAGPDAAPPLPPW